MAKVTGASVVRVGHQIAEATLEPAVKSDLVGYLWSLAGIQVSEKLLQAALRRHPMLDELLKHSSTVQALAAEKLAEGRKEEALRMTKIALTRRFGSLDARLEQALEQADVATLEDMAFDDTLTREQLEARLGLRPTP
jgi:DNA-binding protein Fis